MKRRSVVLNCALAVCAVMVSAEAMARGGAARGGVAVPSPFVGLSPGASKGTVLHPPQPLRGPHYRGRDAWPLGVAGGGAYPLGYAPYPYPYPPVGEVGPGPGVVFVPGPPRCGAQVFHVPAEQGGERAVTVTRC